MTPVKEVVLITGAAASSAGRWPMSSRISSPSSTSISSSRNRAAASGRYASTSLPTTVCATRCAGARELRRAGRLANPPRRLLRPARGAESEIRGDHHPRHGTAAARARSPSTSASLSSPARCWRTLLQPGERIEEDWPLELKLHCAQSKVDAESVIRELQASWRSCCSDRPAFTANGAVPLPIAADRPRLRGPALSGGHPARPSIHTLDDLVDAVVRVIDRRDLPGREVAIRRREPIGAMRARTPPSCQSAYWTLSVNAVKLSPPQIALKYCQPLKASQK